MANESGKTAARTVNRTEGKTAGKTAGKTPGSQASALAAKRSVPPKAAAAPARAGAASAGQVVAPRAAAARAAAARKPAPPRRADALAASAGQAAAPGTAAAPAAPGKGGAVPAMYVDRRAPAPTSADVARATGLLQILGSDGKLLAGVQAPALSPERLLEMYRGMVRIRVMDERLMGLQRQGRIGFYGEARGQEAAVIGSASAAGAQDWIVPALREAGAALYRGLPMRSYVAQILGNANDITKGRQMPCHPGSRATRYLTMSSCIATQLPHATGIAWAAKMRGDKSVVLAYLGDGATSEGDFHVAVNFAAVYGAPVVFVCQNNQWAISTPGAVQTVSSTIAVKALGYGIPGVRCDGNDALAVHAATSAAVDRARAGGGPSLIECLTYRVSAHSSSDDPSRYRDERITEEWRRKDPIARLRTFLLGRRLLTEKDDEALRVELDAEVREAVLAEETAGPPALETIVEDVFAEPTPALREQLAELLRVRERFGPAGGHG